MSHAIMNIAEFVLNVNTMKLLKVCRKPKELKPQLGQTHSTLVNEGLNDIRVPRYLYANQGKININLFITHYYIYGHMIKLTSTTILIFMVISTHTICPVDTINIELT